MTVDHLGTIEQRLTATDGFVHNECSFEGGTTMLLTEAGLVELDPAMGTRDEARAAVFEARQQGQWIVRIPIGYLVIEHDAVRELQRDPRLGGMGTRLLEVQGITGGPAYERTKRAILNLQGDEHTRLRRLVARAFTPRATDRLRPLMHDYVDRRARQLAAKGQADVVAEMIEEYPIHVICELVGVPDGDWPKFSHWADEIFKLFNLNAAEDLPAIEAAQEDIRAYVEDLIERRRDDPGDDLLSELLAIEEAGDRLDHDEMVDLVIAVLLGGTDTTRNQLGLALIELAHRPDQWDRLVADPSLVPQAVEEALRFEPTAAGTPRVAAQDLEYRGLTIPAGTFLTLSTAAANRDPDVVRCPMDFDVTADREGWSVLTFGSGPHYCLGANLARAELREAFDVLVRTWRRFELASEPEMKPTFGLYGPRTLPLRIDPL